MCDGWHHNILLTSSPRELVLCDFQMNPSLQFSLRTVISGLVANLHQSPQAKVMELGIGEVNGAMALGTALGLEEVSPDPTGAWI